MQRQQIEQADAVFTRLVEAAPAQRLCRLALSAFRETADLFRRTLAVHPHLESGRANLGTA